MSSLLRQLKTREEQADVLDQAVTRLTEQDRHRRRGIIHSGNSTFSRSAHGYLAFSQIARSSGY